MMHVTLIAGTYQPQRCGVAHYTLRLRQALHRRDIHTTVLTTHEAANDLGDRSNVNIKDAVKDWSLPQLLPLVRVIFATPTDILHIQHAAGSYRFERSLFLLPPLLRALGYRPPLVVTLHEYGWWEWQPKWLPAQPLEWVKQSGQRRGWWDREDGFLITGAQASIVTNPEAAGVLRERLPHHSPRFVPIAANVGVAPEVVEMDPGKLRASLRSRLGWPQDAKIAAFFGFLHPTKGLEILLSAFQRVQQQCPQTKLLVSGGVRSLALGDEADWYWEKLHRLAQDLGLADHVAFTGYLEAEAISTHLLAADMGVLPFNHGVTLKSGSLLALLAHGLPTVATTANPPDPNLTDDLLQLVPARQPDALATAMASLLKAPSRRDRLRQSGLSFVRQFSWEAIAAQHVDIYQDLLC